MSSMFPLGH